MSAIVLPEQELHRIRCPYCVVGGALFRLQRKRGTNQIRFTPHETLKCDTCRDSKGRPNEFKVQPMLSFRGVGLDYKHGRRPALEKRSELHG